MPSSKRSPLVISRSKPKYHINMNDFLRVPANFYWKDVSGVHLGCNEFAANDTGLSCTKDYVGLTIYDISEKKQAEIIEVTDQQVIQSAQPNCILESSGSKLSKQAIYLSIKSPLYSDQGKICGLFGTSFKLTDERLFKITHLLDAALIPNGFSLINDAFYKYHLSQDLLKKAALTKRESTVLFHICQGKTVKEVAKILGISDRTIETHIERIRFKTDCKNKFELIERFSLLKNIL